MWAQLKTVMLLREAIQLAFLWATRRTTFIFSIKIIIYNLVLTRFYIHVAINLINKSDSFHGKHQIVWVTPNSWTVVYLYIYVLHCFRSALRRVKVFFPSQIFLSGPSASAARHLHENESWGFFVFCMCVLALNLPNWCWECKSNPIIGNVGLQPLWGKILETLMVI